MLPCLGPGVLTASAWPAGESVSTSNCVSGRAVYCPALNELFQHRAHVDSHTVVS